MVEPSVSDRIGLLIAGLGNYLLRDDGVGVHAARELERDPPAGAIVVEVGTAVLDALYLFERADRILAIDAVQAGGHAGTIYELSVAPSRQSRQIASLHEFDLRDTLELISGTRRPAVRVLGVEPQDIGFGLELSLPVRAALPELLAAVRRLASTAMVFSTDQPTVRGIERQRM